MLFKKRNVDFEKGKRLYYEYYGNKFGLYWDLGNEYSNCNIPKKVENEWNADIMDHLEDEISKAQGSSLQLAVDRYIKLLKVKYEWLMAFLETKEMDTFTAIILCESLKNMARLVKNRSTKKRIRHFLDEYKVKLLHEPIVVHESYKSAEYMCNYDFSDENIKARINEI